MFRPNRIGTPHIMSGASYVYSTSNWTPADRSIQQVYAGNVINAVPLLDFGQAAIRWAGSEAVVAFQRICIGVQFTVTPPIAGDVKGIELGGSMTVDLPAADSMYPVCFRVEAAGLAVWDQVTTTEAPSILGPEVPGLSAIRTGHYQTQLVTQLAAGTYFHGFALQDSGSGFTLQALHAEFYVRQLNDQQSIGYRDTLR